MTPVSVDKNGWVLCPICGCKTRVKVRKETEFSNLPLFCPKCRNETIASLGPKEMQQKGA